MQKICAIGDQNEVFILGGQRIDQKRRRDGMVGREKREEKGSRERIEIERKGVNNLKRRIRNINTCLCLFPQGAFLLSSRLDSAVKCCSIEVLKLSFQPELLGKGSGPKRLVKY